MANYAPPKQSAWQQVSDRALSVMMQRKDLWERACYEHDVRVTDMPPTAQQTLYAALSHLHNHNQAVTDASVQATAPSLSLDYIQNVWVLADAIETDAFDTYVVQLKEYGAKYRMRSAAQDFIRRLEEGRDDFDKLRAQLIGRIQMDAAQPIEDSSNGALADKIEALMNAPVVPPISTGIDWVDRNLAGGLLPDEVLGIGGRYGGGKTRTAMNILLGCLEDGAFATVAAFENTQVSIAYNLIAMLAVRYLWLKGWYNDTFVKVRKDEHGIDAENTYNVNGIYGRLLRRAGKSWRKWDEKQVVAIEHGLSLFKHFGGGKALSVYDQSAKGGALAGVDDLERIIRRDQMLYGTNRPHVVFVDHATLMSKAERYADMPVIAARLINLAQRYHCAIVALTQLTEEAVKGGRQGNSVSAMGGGSLPAAVHTFLTVQYKDDTDEVLRLDDTRMRMRFGKAREGISGADAQADFTVHPQTGLIIR